MPETPVPTPPGFDALSKAEQVRYLQRLWDQISEDPGTLPVSESHLRLAEERLKRYREDPSRSHSAFEVLDRLADTSSADSKSK
jgi:putative addiction module component (TIGR02574 family)